MLPDLECTTPQLQAILGVSVQTITNYTLEGTPKARRGVFDLAAVQWVVDYTSGGAPDTDEARRGPKAPG